MPETYIDDDGREVLMLVDGLPFERCDVDAGTLAEVDALAEVAAGITDEARLADLIAAMREMLAHSVRRARKKGNS